MKKANPIEFGGALQVNMDDALLATLWTTQEDKENMAVDIMAIVEGGYWIPITSIMKDDFSKGVALKLARKIVESHNRSAELLESLKELVAISKDGNARYARTAYLRQFRKAKRVIANVEGCSK